MALCVVDIGVLRQEGGDGVAGGFSGVGNVGCGGCDELRLVRFGRLGGDGEGLNVRRVRETAARGGVEDRRRRREGEVWSIV